MINKRVIFYFVSLIFLMSLYLIYVWAAGESITVGMTSITSGTTTVTALNITTGANLNVTCVGTHNSSLESVGPVLAVQNLTLHHNLNNTGVLSLNISTTTTPFIGLVNSTATGTNLTATFVVFINTTLTFDENGALSGSVSPLTDGNYTFSCQAGINVTNVTYEGAAFQKKWGQNITVTIDRQRPNFSVTSLNVTDGTNTIVLDELNGTKHGVTKAYLRNNSRLDVKVTVTEPHFSGGAVRIYWVANESALPGINTPTANTLNPNNATMNVVSAPAGKSNISVFNGSLRYAGIGPYSNDSAVAQTDRLITLTEGATLTFMIVTNDSAGNFANLSNNGKGFNITFDGSDPAVTFSLSKSRISVENELIATCEANDTSPVKFTVTLTKPSGATVVKIKEAGSTKFEPSFKAKDTGEAGKYKVKCEVEDSVQFTASKEEEFTAQYESEDLVSVEEEETEKQVAEVDLSKAVDGQIPEGTITGIQGESTTFTLDGETQHTLTFLTVTATSATIRLESTPVDITLNTGETKEVDLNGDGEKDITVTLTSIVDEEAKVVVKPLKLPEKIEETPVVPTETTPTETPSRAGVIIVVLLILAVVVAAYFLLKGKKGKKGEIRFTSKDLSSEYKF